VRTAYDVHRLRRDAWITRLRAAHGTVPVAAAAYALPDMDTAAEAIVAAAGIEQRCAEAYAGALAGLTATALRTQLVADLADAARRSYGLLRDAGVPASQASTALPGQVG
jgi:outer membrane receptor for ferrienterochelin and colicin